MALTTAPRRAGLGDRVAGTRRRFTGVPAVLGALIRRDWLTARSYRFSFALGLVVSLFMLVVLFYVGRLVDRSHVTTADSLDGHDYFSYVVIGMAVLQVVHSALGSFAVKLQQEQTTGTLEALLSTPVPPAVLILGSALFDLLRAVAQSLVLVAIAVAFGLRFHGGPGHALVAVVAFLSLLAMFAGLGVLVASYTVVFKRGTQLSGLIAGGLALLGGVYFPVTLLPGPIRALASALPFTWGVDVLRQTLLGGPVSGWRLVGIAATAAVGLPVALAVFRLAVDQARRRGTLAQY